MTGGTRWAGVAFGLTLAVLATFEHYKLPPVLPILLERYGYDPKLAGGLMAIYALLGLALSVRAGHALERLGLRLVEAACAAIAVGCALGLAMPESGLVMLAARGFEGLGFTVLAIAGPAIAMRAAAPGQAVFVAGISAAWVPIGQLLANAIAYPFAAAGSWQWVWWVALGAALAVLAWTRAAGPRGFTLSAGAAGTAASAAERRALVLASLVYLLWAGQYISFVGWLNVYLVTGLGLGADQAIGAASLVPFAVLVLNLATGWAMRAGLPLAPVFVGSIAIEAAVWFAVPWLDGAAGLVGLVLYGVCCGMTPVCLFAMPGIVMGHKGAGAAAFGVLMRGRNFGVLAGPLLLPLVVERFGGWDAVWPLYGALTLGAGAGAWLLVRRLVRLGAVTG